MKLWVSAVFLVPLQYEISITHATIYLYVHIYQPFIVYVYVALWNLNLINTYLIAIWQNPTFTQISQYPVQNMYLYQFYLLFTMAIFAYYAGIMLNALATLLCSKLCWHNRLKPSNYAWYVILLRAFAAFVGYFIAGALFLRVRHQKSGTDLIIHKNSGRTSHT